MGEPFLSLLLLVSVTVFVLGIGVGTQVCVLALRQRDQRLSDERRVLNRIWFVLHNELGIHKAAWMANELDTRRQAERRAHQPSRLNAGQSDNQDIR